MRMKTAAWVMNFWQGANNIPLPRGCCFFVPAAAARRFRIAVEMFILFVMKLKLPYQHGIVLQPPGRISPIGPRSDGQ